jgi:hypothetical protein
VTRDAPRCWSRVLATPIVRKTATGLLMHAPTNLFRRIFARLRRSCFQQATALFETHLHLSQPSRLHHGYPRSIRLLLIQMQMLLQTQPPRRRPGR